MVRNSWFLSIGLLFFLSCSSTTEIEKYGSHYQEHQDYFSLQKVVELMALGVDKNYVSTILGEPIDMGFDYRYLVDSIGQNGCVIGAVFHIDETDKVDQKWIDEICE